ncbi:hypothetical protein GUJ93_ZPchr0009g1770 [Zizania palustris]|uniref:Uncharacterized protein n=1 Tax=Zizania palustris TaxID=103762 RepID=A0A8J5UXJ7_ZIZPA|nr:hypothetical protein GUJ93_ZPchr0009g1770 [Zizania palustris]
MAKLKAIPSLHSSPPLAYQISHHHQHVHRPPSPPISRRWRRMLPMTLRMALSPHDVTLSLSPPLTDRRRCHAGIIVCAIASAPSTVSTNRRGACAGPKRTERGGRDIHKIIEDHLRIKERAGEQLIEELEFLVLHSVMAVYIAEIATQTMRGALGVVNQVIF